jgi:hypothetical protein
MNRYSGKEYNFHTPSEALSFKFYRNFEENGHCLKISLE